MARDASSEQIINQRMKINIWPRNAFEKGNVNWNYSIATNVNQEMMKMLLCLTDLLVPCTIMRIHRRLPLYTGRDIHASE